MLLCRSWPTCFALTCMFLNCVPVNIFARVWESTVLAQVVLMQRCFSRLQQKTAYAAGFLSNPSSKKKKKDAGWFRWGPLKDLPERRVDELSPPAEIEMSADECFFGKLGRTFLTTHFTFWTKNFWCRIQAAESECQKFHIIPKENLFAIQYQYHYLAWLLVFISASFFFSSFDFFEAVRFISFFIGLNILKLDYFLWAFLKKDGCGWV